MNGVFEPYDAVPSARPDDPRLVDLVHFARGGRCETGTRVALLGFPSDEGVRINGGRPGAAAGPDAIRKWLYSMTPDARALERHARLLGQTVDLGNLRLSEDLAHDQQRLGEVLAELIAAGVLPIVMGGGHETSFGHFLGYALAGREVSLLNIDAHPDVRPLVSGKPHSGSPFRQALEHPSGACRGYVVAGLNPHSVAPSHVRFVTSRGGRCFWNGEMQTEDIQASIASGGSPWLASFDLDAVDASCAPGVSAPNAHGMSTTMWLKLADLVGTSPRVTSLDIVELNPRHDVDDRTARLAALTLWRFLRGLVDRPA